MHCVRCKSCYCKVNQVYFTLSPGNGQGWKLRVRVTQKNDSRWTRTPVVTQPGVYSDHFDSSTFTYIEKLSY